MPKDESRVQSLLSAFTRKRAAPPKERPAVKPSDAETNSAYTTEMKTAIPLIAGVAGAAWDMLGSSSHNKIADPEDKLSATQRAAGAIINGASWAAAASDFTNTTGSSMPVRILRASAIAAAAPMASGPLIKPGMLRNVKKKITIAYNSAILAQQEAQFKAITGADHWAPSFGRAGRPFL
jgi:hypothetical protein